MPENNKQQGNPVNKVIPRAAIDMNKAIRWLSTWSAWLVVAASIGILAVVAFFISEEFSNFAKQYGLYFIVNAFCTIAIFISFFRDGTINGKTQEGYITNLSLYLATSKNRRKDKVEKFLAFSRRQEKNDYKLVVADITGMTFEQILECDIKKAYKKGEINKVQRKHINNIQTDKYPNTVPSSANRVLSALGTKYRKDSMVDLDATKRFIVRKFVGKIVTMVIFSFPAGFLALDSVAKDPWAALLKLFISIVLFCMSIIGGYQGGFRSMSEVEKDTLGELVKLFGAMDEWEANPPIEEEPKHDERANAARIVSTQGTDNDLANKAIRPEHTDRVPRDNDQSSAGGYNSVGQITGFGVTEQAPANTYQQSADECSDTIQPVARDQIL